MSIKTDNTQTLVNALAEIERLRGRVSELEEAANLAQDPCRAFYKQGRDGGWKAYSAVKEALKGDSGAWLLRKQAEAVEVLAKRLQEAAAKADEGPDESDTACTLIIAKSVALNEAQRLRNQADELENNNAQEH